MKRIANHWPRVILLLASLASGGLGIGCNPMSLSAPAQSSGSASASDFFWQPSGLQRGIHYSVTRDTFTSEHVLTSYDGLHIFDNNSTQNALLLARDVGRIMLDSIGSNPLFVLPAGVNLGPNKDGSHAAFVLLRDTDNLMIGSSWSAGVVNDSIQSASIEVPLTARVLTRVDSLYTPHVKAGVDSTFGETILVRYTMEDANGDISTGFPLYWLIYYTRGIGPVRLEEYSLEAGVYVLKNRAVYIR